MNFDKTAAYVAADLKPKSGADWVRVVFATSICFVGLTDIVVTRIVREPPGPWEWMPLLLIFGGAGLLFTGSVIAIAKALLPWKSRNGP